MPEEAPCLPTGQSDCTTAGHRLVSPRCAHCPRPWHDLCSPGHSQQLPDSLLWPGRKWRVKRRSPGGVFASHPTCTKHWFGIQTAGAACLGSAPAWDPPEGKAAAQPSSKPEPSENSPVHKLSSKPWLPRSHPGPNSHSVGGWEAP